MNLPLAGEADQQSVQTGTQPQKPSRRFFSLRALRAGWEIYPILLIAGFFRFYQIDRTVYLQDEAIVFRMARDFFVHGLFPITSNRSSLGNMNPPFVVYLMMIPAAVSGNPLWGEVFVAFCCTLAVLLTYLFTRRYYGRLAATIAAALFATSSGAILYSRNIWPQNFLPLFTMMFLFLLFRGVVERRKGWFVPAVLLLVLLYQLHGSSIFLAIPFLLAMIFAFKTLRWHDFVLALMGGLVLLAPFLAWEMMTRFVDLQYYLRTTKAPKVTDRLAFEYYNFFLSPFAEIGRRVGELSTDPASVWQHWPLSALRRLLLIVNALMPPFFIGVVLVTLVRIVWPRFASAPAADPGARRSWFVRWWMDFCSSPRRQGLLLLLSWQTLPLLLLISHTQLFEHYFLVFLPGQFILIALCITGILDVVRGHLPGWRIVIRYGLYVLMAGLIAVQLLGCTGVMTDTWRGHFNADTYYYDLTSLRNALTTADALAQQRHIHRIYISTDIYSSTTPVTQLTEDMRTPTTVFDHSHCFALPGPGQGPALVLSLSSSHPLSEAMLRQFTRVLLVEELPRFAQEPFRLYLVEPRAATAPAPASFTHGLQLLSPTALLVQSQSGDAQWLTTSWRMTETHTAAPRSGIVFHVNAQSGITGPSTSFSCWLSATRAGDQLLLFTPMEKRAAFPAALTMKLTAATTQPVRYQLGPLTLVTFDVHDVNAQELRTRDGKNEISVPVGTA